jgi:hypothetical protein
VVLSPKGSVIWQVVKSKNRDDLWVERRELSDRILTMWKEV